MRPLTRLVPILLLPLFLSACELRPVYRGMLVLGEKQQLKSHEILEGDLLILGGEVQIHEGALVTGNVYQLAGQLILSGEIQGGLSVVSGLVRLEDTALILGDLRSGGGTLERSQGAAVLGELQLGVELPEELTSRPNSWQGQLRQRAMQTVILAVIAYLLGTTLAHPMDRIWPTAFRYPLLALAIGLFGAIVGLVLIVQMAFTIILIPIMLLGLIFFILLAIYGWVAIGQGLATLLPLWKRERPHTQWRSVIGTVSLNLIATMIEFIPLIGPWVPVIAALTGIGAVLLTRFGSRPFSPSRHTQVL